MKKFLIIAQCVIALGFTPLLAAQGTGSFVETSSNSVLTGFFRSVWANLKSFNPSQKESANSEAVYTAGIRGAEATESLLQPYWKNDLSQDQQFQAELQKFSQAQVKMDRGELAAAAEAFDEFLQEFGQSSLCPNALFGKSISLAAIGQTEQSLITIRKFIAENPRHPLVGDARKIIQELS